ncbi:MAG: thioredoxin domain-containing protein [Gemmatimonadaceae bacterium]|nr:thioredoxin domain-containing protein [Gemmatimonadaceae bacterium]
MRREFFAPAPQIERAQATDVEPRHIREWQEVMRVAREAPDTNALVIVASFVDVECPYCKHLAQTLAEWKERVGDDASILTIHFPLSQHRFARPAARALECARLQGRFSPMLRYLFAQQDSLGLFAWTEAARKAGVVDTVAFATCNRATNPIPGVEEGVALGRRLGIKATPTVLVNEYLYSQPPSLEELDQMLVKEKARRRAVR